jgi:hypothetical protein
LWVGTDVFISLRCVCMHVHAHMWKRERDLACQWCFHCVSMLGLHVMLEIQFPWSHSRNS